MTALRAFLGLTWFALVAYTLIVVRDHGVHLLPVFFGDMAAFTWPGQFNSDFFCFLLGSATWVAWRHQFSAAGLLLAPLALFGGWGFLAPYLLIQSFRVHGDVASLLLGERRAGHCAAEAA